MERLAVKKKVSRQRASECRANNKYCPSNDMSGCVTHIKCVVCGEVKNIEAYEKDELRSHNRMTTCRSCRCEQHRKRYNKNINTNRERGRIRSKRWYDKKRGATIDELIKQRHKYDSAGNPTHRKCNKCGEFKEMEEYKKETGYKYGRRSVCRLCLNKQRRANAACEENKEKNKVRRRKWYEQNKETICEKAKQKRAEMRLDKINSIEYQKKIAKAKEKAKEKYIKVQIASIERATKYLITNGTKYKLCNSCGQFLSDIEYSKNSHLCKHCESVKYYKAKESNIEVVRKRWRKAKLKKMSKVQYRINKNISERIRQSLKGGKGGRKAIDILGYSIHDLMVHLEERFTIDMTWDNYGMWHIDHIIPVAAFGYTTTKHPDFKKCWALSNLQPLWAKDNLRKSAKVPKGWPMSQTGVIRQFGSLSEDYPKP